MSSRHITKLVCIFILSLDGISLTNQLSKTTSPPSSIRGGRLDKLSGAPCLSLCLFCRMKALSEPVYTQKEADMAAGMGSYSLPPAPLETTTNSPAVCMEEMASLSVNDDT